VSFYRSMRLRPIQAFYAASGSTLGAFFVCCAIAIQASGEEFVNYGFAGMLGGGSEDLLAADIAVDGTGFIYITGYFGGTADFAPGSGTYLLESHGSHDVFVAKFTANGALVWAVNVGGSELDHGNAIAVDASGVYVTGNFEGTADFNPGGGAANVTSNGDSDIFLLKLDGDGGYLWRKTIGGAGYDAGINVKQDPSGSLYLTGVYSGDVDFDPGPAQVLVAGYGDTDIFVLKLDPTGAFGWARGMGSSQYDYGRGLALDSFGNVYTTGTYQYTADFDPGAGSYELSSLDNSWDIFVSKLDQDGDFVWAKAVGGHNSDWGRALAVDASGTVFVAGSFRGVVDFDPDFPSVFVEGVDSDNGYVWRLDSDGTYLGVTAFGQPDGAMIASDLALKPNGKVCVCGEYYGTLDFNFGSDPRQSTSAGEGDIVITLLEPDGTHIWTRAVGGSDYDGCNSMALDADGHIYTTGRFRGTVDFHPGSSSTVSLTSEPNYSGFFLKLSSFESFSLPSAASWALIFLGLLFIGASTYVLRHRLSAPTVPISGVGVRHIRSRTNKE